MAFKKSKAIPKRGKVIQFNDSFQNAPANLGMGANNLFSQSRYTLNPITRSRLELEFMYRGSWIAAAAVDLPAEDMTRAGVTITDIDAEENDIIQEQIIETNMFSSLCEAEKWAALYGACLLYIMIDGQDPSTPLDVDTIDVGQYRGLMTLDRWQVTPSISDVVTELGPDFGLPRFYDALATKVLSNTVVRIHHSRVIRFIGIELPFQQRIAEMGWGESILERLYDRLVAFDSGTTGAAQMLYKAHLRTLKIDGLRDIIAAGNEIESGLKQQMSFMRQTQSNEGITLLDMSDEYDSQTYSFGGIRDIIMTFAEQISGALQIPMVRLFGQEPGGLSSDGDSALHTYYDNLSKKQERSLRRPIGKILDIICRSSLGHPLPPGTRFHFNSLWQMEEGERAEVASKDTDTIIKAFTAMIIDQKTAAQELRNLSNVNKLFSNIPDDQIKDTKPQDLVDPVHKEINSTEDKEHNRLDPRETADNSMISNAEILGLTRNKGVMK